MRILTTWLILSLIIMLSAYILPGVEVQDFVAALVAAFVLGLLNAFLKPILVLLTLPITIVTLGLFTLVINSAIVLLASAIVPGFEIANFWWALLFSIIVSLSTALITNKNES